MSPATAVQALLSTARRSQGEHVFHLEDGIVRLPCDELAERAEAAARRLLALGVEPGDAVGVLGPNRPEWIVWAFATWIAGAIVVPVQIPLRVRDPAAFAEQVRGLAAAGGCRRVLADPRLLPLLPERVAVTWEEGGEGSGEALPRPPAADPAVIQFTSGSTAAPKGALLTHAAVTAQMDLLRPGYRYPDGSPRTVLSWTPFFHDLGLFANLVQPAYTGSTTHHLPTERFAKDPAEWLRLVERTRVSATVGPSSAFGSALRAAEQRGERIDLGSLEAACFAAEGVDPEVSRRMVERARDMGLRPEAIGATYGLAEAVMAASFRYVGTGLRLDRVALPELAATGTAAPAERGPARTIVSSGFPQMDLRIVGADAPLPERQVGEIQLRGPSLMSRYVGADIPDPFVDGWLRTGDLGYLADGELFVTGRAKDVLIAMGHNYYPEDFEWAAARVDGVRPGRCVAFGTRGRDEVVVLVESSDSAGASDRLARRVRNAISDAIGIAPAEVVVLPPGTVEKTTSGKLRRGAMRDAYASGGLGAATA